MNLPLPSQPSVAPGDLIGDAYLAVLPTIRRIAHGYFRHIPCADRRHELIAETVALGWLWFVRLVARQKDPGQFLVVFSYTVARAVSSGRRLCGSEKAKDVLSPVCQRMKGFVVASLPDSTSMIGNTFDEALRDNRFTPVPDQVQFRIDFRRWRTGLSAVRRRMLDRLAAGERTDEAAARFQVTPGRISQIRKALHLSWQTFCGDYLADSQRPDEGKR